MGSCREEGVWAVLCKRWQLQRQWGSEAAAVRQKRMMRQRIIGNNNNNDDSDEESAEC